MKESIIIVFFKNKILQKSTKLLQRKITLSLCKGTFSYWKFYVNKPSTEFYLTLCHSYQYYVSSNLYDREISYWFCNFLIFFNIFYHNWESSHASTMEFMDC